MTPIYNKTYSVRNNESCSARWNAGCNKGCMSGIAKRVVARRLQLGLSQSELARRIGVKPQTIQSLESGRTKSFRNIVDLARALEVPLAWFAAPESTMAETPDDTTTSLEQFGRRVAAARRRLGLSPEDAARGIMTPEQWLAMEAGEVWPLPPVLDQVCRVMDEPADYLVRGLAAAPRNSDLLPETPTLHAKVMRFEKPPR